MANELSAAARRGDVKEVKRILKTNLFGINEVKICGYASLYFAVTSNYIEVVEILLNHNVDVNNSVGIQPPLHAAAGRGHAEMVTLLLKHGAEADTENGLGLTPLEIAADNNHTEVVEILVTYNTDLNTSRPLYIAAYSGHMEMVKYLLNHGADPNKIAQCTTQWLYLPGDPNGTALHVAAMNRHTSIVEVLLTYGADPYIKDEEGKTVLDMITDKDSQVYQVLLEHSKKERALDKLKASIGDAVKEYLNVSSSTKRNSPVSLSCDVIPAQNNPEAAVKNLQISTTGPLSSNDTSQVMSKLNTMHDDIKRWDIKMNNASLQDEPHDIPIQSVKHKRLLQSLVVFTTNLHCIDFICEYLLQSGIITISDKHIIKAEKTVREKASTLLTDYLLKKDETALDVFCNALREEGQEYLADKIDCQ